MAGYRREFDETLAAIEAEVIELFAMIADDLPQATAALLNGDGKALLALARAGLTDCGRSAKAGRGAGGSPAAGQIQKISGPLKHPAHSISGQPVLISLIAGHFPRLNAGGQGR
jgi:hypothetical protein